MSRDIDVSPIEMLTFQEDKISMVS